MSHQIPKIIILKNTTISDIEFLGETVPASGQSDFSHVSAMELREDTILIAAINAGDIVVNDGTNDLSIANAILYISAEYTLQIKIDGIAVTSPVSYVDTLDFKGGAVIIDEGTGTISIEVGAGIGFGRYSDVIEFGEGVKIKNRFMHSSYSNHTSLDSTALALGDGEVVHVTISTEQSPTNNWFVQIITNAVKGGTGQFANGTQIGTDLEKPTAVLDKIYTNLTGYNFSAGDRIQVYVKEGTLGTKEAIEPVVRLFVRYD